MGVKLSCHHVLPVPPKEPFSFLQTDQEMVLGTKCG